MAMRKLTATIHEGEIQQALQQFLASGRVISKLPDQATPLRSLSEGKSSYDNLLGLVASR